MSILMPPAWTGATPTTQTDSYYRVDANLSWFNPAQDIRVILSGKNLTEEETWVTSKPLRRDQRVR